MTPRTGRNGKALNARFRFESWVYRINYMKFEIINFGKLYKKETNS